MTTNNKPVCKLIGTDGNIFCLLGKATRCLKESGFRTEAQEMARKVVSTATNYNEALTMIMEYVDVE